MQQFVIKLNTFFTWDDIVVGSLAYEVATLSLLMTQCSSILSFRSCLSNRKVQNHLMTINTTFADHLINIIFSSSFFFSLDDDKKLNLNQYVQPSEFLLRCLLLHLWFASSSWEEENWSSSCSFEHVLSMHVEFLVSLWTFNAINLRLFFCLSPSSVGWARRKCIATLKKKI